MRYWEPVWAKTTATRFLPHPENECQWSVNNFWSCILGNQGIAWILEHITEVLTPMLGKNTIYQTKNPDSKIIDLANCKTSKKRLFLPQYVILRRYYYHIATTSVLYESVDGPTG